MENQKIKDSNLVLVFINANDTKDKTIIGIASSISLANSWIGDMDKDIDKGFDRFDLIVIPTIVDGQPLDKGFIHDWNEALEYELLSHYGDNASIRDFIRNVKPNTQPLSPYIPRETQSENQGMSGSSLFGKSKKVGPQSKRSPEQFYDDSKRLGEAWLDKIKYTPDLMVRTKNGFIDPFDFLESRPEVFGKQRDSELDRALVETLKLFREIATDETVKEEIDCVITRGAAKRVWLGNLVQAIKSVCRLMADAECLVDFRYTYIMETLKMFDLSIYGDIVWFKNRSMNPLYKPHDSEDEACSQFFWECVDWINSLEKQAGTSLLPMFC